MSAMFTTSRRRLVDKMKKYGLGSSRLEAVEERPPR
jgi:hypothetical protein